LTATFEFYLYVCHVPYDEPGVLASLHAPGMLLTM